MWAAYKGNAEEVERIIDDQPTQLGPNKGSVKIGRWVIRDGTALMIAAVRGHERVVELLVKENGVRIATARPPSCLQHRTAT